MDNRYADLLTPAGLWFTPTVPIRGRRADGRGELLLPVFTTAEAARAYLAARAASAVVAPVHLADPELVDRLLALCRNLKAALFVVDPGTGRQRVGTIAAFRTALGPRLGCPARAAA